MQATAQSYAISPAVLADVQADPARSPDQLSASWLLALATRLLPPEASVWQEMSHHGIPQPVNWAAKPARTRAGPTKGSDLSCGIACGRSWRCSPL
jgi:hypothetical protein